MRLLAELGMQAARQVRARKVVGEGNACLAYFRKFVAALRNDLVLVLRVPGQKFFGANGMFGSVVMM